MERPWQATLSPLMLVTIQPSCWTLPSMVAVRPWPPTSCAVIWTAPVCGSALPVTCAIDFIPSQEIMPVNVLFGPTTMCQSIGGQEPFALESNA